jgi:hypothetical protein
MRDEIAAENKIMSHSTGTGYSDSKTPEGARHTPPGSPVPAPRTSRQSPQWPTLNRLTRRTSDMHNSKIHHDIQHIITNTTVNAHTVAHTLDCQT